MVALKRAIVADADNPTAGDLFIDSTGQLVLVDGSDAVAQHLRGRLRIFLGEWFLDERIGFPYFRDVFIKNPNHASILSSLRRTITGTPGISGVDELTLSVNAARQAVVSFRAQLADGGDLDFGDFILGDF